MAVELSVDEIVARKAWREMGLTDQEFELVVQALGRRPNWTELGMFAVLWSEHCAYKHSRALFHLFPTEGPRVLQGPGENAGVVDMGDGLAVAFKIESHNHPSAIEPYQGAATGVGGILRDIFAMGARPIALLDSLRFGPLEDERVRYLFAGVVAGISGYGNSVGVPTVGGEVYFDPAYRGNPLVNVMCVGIVPHRHVTTARARGVGNPVMIVGARTGRDGIHGASFASTELSEASEERRPSVQVGDPFTEKLLIEACLELIEAGVVVGIQDMGAAGLTSSAAEMASRAGSGIELDLDHVPLREEGMTPYEIMLSESQERMLVVPVAGAESRVQQIFRKWGLEAAVIGRVTDDGRLRVRWRGQVVADVPARALSTDGAPKYQPEARRPAYLDELWARPLPAPVADPTQALFTLLDWPSIASKRWVFEQYDYMVRTSTVVGPGADAAVLRVRGTRRGLAVTVDCNSLYCYLDPRRGAMLAVAEAARNVACTGAEPLGITDGMNFGNPERPEIFWQFRESVLGIAEACRAFGIPVTGGNVSFYNERVEASGPATPADGSGPDSATVRGTHAESVAIYPTPMIGLVGLLEDVERYCHSAFQREGDRIYLLGAGRPTLGASQYLLALHGLVAGRPPEADLEAERRLQQALVAAVREGLLASAHDCAEGGLAVALAECCLWSGLGARVELPPPSAGERWDTLLFGESGARVVASCRPEHAARLEALLGEHGVPAQLLGSVGGAHLEITWRGVAAVAAPPALRADVAEMARTYEAAIPRRMGEAGPGPAVAPGAPSSTRG